VKISAEKPRECERIGAQHNTRTTPRKNFIDATMLRKCLVF
jgi:hypothetical protein